MLVTGYYHDGVIELPKDYQIFKEGTELKMEIIEDEIDFNKFPYIKDKMEKIKALRNWMGPFKESGLSDKELLMEGIRMKYFQDEK